MVARGGIEPPTRGFSVRSRRFWGLKNQPNLSSSRSRHRADPPIRRFLEFGREQPIHRVVAPLCSDAAGGRSRLPAKRRCDDESGGAAEVVTFEIRATTTRAQGDVTLEESLQAKSPLIETHKTRGGLPARTLQGECSSVSVAGRRPSLTSRAAQTKPRLSRGPCRTINLPAEGRYNSSVTRARSIQ
jgi:hypothetical protein